jgi:uncharacterized membrane protein YcaP (DUF421 family)
MFFDGWADLGRVLAVGCLAYSTLVLLVRVSGKRTLAKMNAFDLVVTIALGSTLASALLSADVALAEAAVGFGLLVTLQLIVAWLSVRVRAVRRAVKADPTILLYQGQFREEALRQERVTHGEVRQAVRAQGLGSLDDVEAVVLETDGSLSVISRRNAGSGSALADLAS